MDCIPMTMLMKLVAAEPALAAVASDNDGLTFADILANLPSDPASVFVILLLAGSLAGILWVGRARGPRRPGSGM